MLVGDKFFDCDLDGGVGIGRCDHAELFGLAAPNAGIHQRNFYP